MFVVMIVARLFYKQDIKIRTGPEFRLPYNSEISDNFEKCDLAV